MALRVATYNYPTQRHALPILKEESTRANRVRGSSQGDVDRMEQQSHYVTNKEYNSEETTHRIILYPKTTHQTHQQP